MSLVTILFFFCADSRAWTVARVTFTWQCVYNDTAYNVTNYLITPEATVQLTLDDDTAVHFPYRRRPSGPNSFYSYMVRLPQQLLIDGIKSAI